jgi:hypothetical protein
VKSLLALLLLAASLSAQERLPEVRTTARTPCRVHPDSSAETAALWLVAREALESAARPTDPLPVLTLMEWRRTLDNAQRLRRERVDTQQVSSRNPFARAAPGDLERVGYIRTHGLTTVYYGPDAELLLSERFLRRHCFRRVMGLGADSGLAGLGFEPLPRAGRPDVAGVLWVDTLAAGLRRVEYVWTGAPEEARAPGVGGRAEFARLEDGGWIIRRWNIRMPRPAAGLGAGYDGYTDQGGEVLVVEQAGSWKAERRRRGDTTIVRTLSGSVWGGPVRLVEDLRIGTRDGDGPDAFGSLTGFALFPDGTIAVFDQTVPALRLFGPDGRHLRTIGRDGAGPGEYRKISLGLAVDRNGVLLMHDLMNLRVNRWRQDGTALPGWPGAGTRAAFTTRPLQVDTAGNTYLKLMARRTATDPTLELALLRLDSTGAVADTTYRPPIAGPAPAGSWFAPVKHWLIARSGHTVTGSSAAYSVLVAPPRGPAIRIERVMPQVPVQPAERANYQELADAIRRDPRRAQPGPPVEIPAVKPYFTELHPDLDGRIWVQVSTAGERFDPPPSAPQPGVPELPPLRWRSPAAWDVFEPDGSYLGRLTLPWNTTLAEARGNLVWAIQRGEDDENYIVRYRIEGLPRNP